MDVNLQTTRSADASFDTDNIDNNHETSKNSVEDGEPGDDLLGNNNDTVSDADSPVVPQTESDETPKLDKYKKHWMPSAKHGLK